MAKIVGEELKPYVIDQIKIRQGSKGHGSGVNSQRSEDTLEYLNTKTAFVKLASGVYITDERIADEDFKIKNQAKSLARNYVLSGGVTRHNKTNKTQTQWIPQQRSTGSDPTDWYSGAYNIQPQKSNTSGLTNNPMPGITDVSIQSVNRGSITKAQINIKCYTPEQFQLIDVLYMRLGYTVMLEWGNSRYLDNNGKLKNMKYTLIEDTSEDGFFTGFEKNLLSYYEIIEKKRSDENGNYDAMLAKITNFHWDFDPKTSTYNIKLDIISQGDIIESFKINTYPNIKNTEFLYKEEEVEEGEEDKSIKPPNNIISHFMDLQKYLIKNMEGKPKEEISISLGNNKPGISIGTKISPKYSPKITDYNIQKQISTDVIYIYTVIGDGVIGDIDNKSFYIRLQYLLEFINNYVIPIESFTYEKIANIDLDLYTPMYRAPYQISFDPRVCIVNNNLEPLNTKKYYPELPSWSANSLLIDKLLDKVDPLPQGPLQKPPQRNSLPDYMKDAGWTMNMYLNFDNIQKNIDNNIDENGELNLYSFIEGLCIDINKAMGGVNNLEPVIEDNTLYIIDSSFSYKDIKNLYTMNLYGYDGNTSNFVRDFNLKSSITPNLATMITIGATSNGYVKGTENTMFSKWNTGLIDRFKKSYISVGGDSNEEDPSSIVVKYREELFDKYGYKPFGYINPNKLNSKFTYSNSISMDDEIIERNIALATEFYKYLQTYINSEDPNYSSPTNGFIPISLGITMDGMSGIKIYNSINTNTRFLPPNYGKNLEFIIKGVNHKLSNQDWETNIETVVISKSEESVGKKYPYLLVKKYTNKLLKEHRPSTYQIKLQSSIPPTLQNNLFITQSVIPIITQNP